MSTILKLVQGTDEWHEHRLRYRNASEAPAVMEVSPWVSPYQLWELKTKRKVQEVNFAMQRGSAMEPLARAAYEAESGSIMEPCVMVDGEYSASLDGVSFDGSLLLEVKCPMKGRESDTWKKAESGKVQPCYYWQLQHQLMVSGAEIAHFYVFDGEVGLLVEVLPNHDDMEKLRLAWDNFIAFIDSDSPPPLTTSDTVMRNDPEWKDAAEDYVTAKRASEVAVEAIEAAKKKLCGLAQHNSEKGYGVAVSKFWKANSTKQEVRVSLCKGEVSC